MRKYNLFLVFLLWSVPLNSLRSQGITDSIHHLPTIEIKANRLNDFTIGIKLEHLDSLSVILASSVKLSDLLDKNTILYTKNFGAGNLSTLTFRGTSSNQSGIYWNGFDMKPPGAGMIDLSIIPVFFFDKLDIQYGGSAALFGSGNMGGALHLGNGSLLGNENQVSTAIMAGSFGEFQEQWQWKIKKQSWGSNTSIQHYSIKNDYPYIENGQSFKRQHAGIEQTAVMQNFEKQWNTNHIDVGLWLQQSIRDIPASISSADMNSERIDKSARLTSRWKKSTGKGLWTTGLAVFHDYLRYKEIPGDTLVLIDSKILNTAVMADASYNTEISKFHTIISAGINAGFSTININKYGHYKEQTQGGVYLLVNQAFLKNKWHVNLSLRQEVVSGYSIPMAPSIGIEGDFCKRLKGRMHLAKNYRIPAMNDRYWIPGGNPDLKPEYGLNSGGGLIWSVIVKENYNLDITADAFYSGIYDWISWTPTSSGYFMAMNIQEVKIKGLEVSLKMETSINALKLQLHGSWSRLEAINQKSLNVYDQSKGKQLIYTPDQRFSGSLRIIYHDLLMSYNQSYTSKAYTNRENAEFVPSFNVADFQFRYKLNKGRSVVWNLQFEVTNIWDAQYEIVRYFPMPGRTYRLGVNCNFKY